MVNMFEIQARKSLDFRFFILLLFAVVAISFGLASFTYKVVVLGIIVVWFTILFAIAPRGGFLLLLLIRPSADVFRNFGFEFGPVATLNVNAMLAIVVIISGVFFLLVHKHRFLDNKVSRFFLAYLAFTLLWGIVVSKNRMNFSAVFLRELSFFTVFYLSFQLFNRKERVKNLTTVCVISSVVPLTVAFQQAIKRGFEFPLYLSSVKGVHPGIQGTFSHPAGLGIYLMLLLLISSGFLLTESKKVSVLKWTALSAILYFFLVLSYYRTAWAGLLVAFVALAIISFRRYRRLLVLVLLLVVISSAVAPSILQRSSEFSSWYWRVRVWNRLLLSGGNTVDYLFGQGLGSISVVLSDAWRMSVVTAHNTYIRALFETGILGTCLFLSVKLLLLKRAYNLLGKDRPECVRAVSIAVFGMSIALFVGYVSQSITGPAVMWYYWAYAGALYGLEHQFSMKKRPVSPFCVERNE